jgi:hypothetical protein
LGLHDPIEHDSEGLARLKRIGEGESEPGMTQECSQYLTFQPEGDPEQGRSCGELRCPTQFLKHGFSPINRLLAANMGDSLGEREWLEVI